MAAPGAADQVKRARRGMWAARLVFYPAVLLAALVFLRQEDIGGHPVKILFGETSQGQRFRINVGEDGRATFVSTRLLVACPNGRPWPVQWRPLKGKTPFEQDGRRLTLSVARPNRYSDGTESWTERTLTGEITRQRASGAMTATERFDQPGGDPLICSSGKVTFTAQR